MYLRLEGLMEKSIVINRLQSVIANNEQILYAARASRWVLYRFSDHVFFANEINLTLFRSVWNVLLISQ